MKEAREILFRAKDICGSAWAYGFYAHDQGNPILGETHLIQPVDDTGHFTSLIRVDPETVSQYIGYTDKTEKKIFVGDIVKAYDSEFRMTFMGEVVYHHGSFCIKEPQDEDLFHFRWEDYYGEVIGNIWDNPELIEANKEDES